MPTASRRTAPSSTGLRHGLAPSFGRPDPLRMYDVLRLAGSLPPVFGLADAGPAGLTRHAIARGVRRGVLHRLGGGFYTTAERWAAADPRDRHVLMARAAAQQRPSAAVSHHSAAAYLSLPLPRAMPPWVALTTDRADATANPGGLARLEPGALPEEHVANLDGVRVTTATRTVTDCLRTLRLSDGVAIADAAIRDGRSSADEITQVRCTQRRWPGVVSVDVGLALVDPARETWLESTAFVKLWRLGFPLPEAQVCVLTAGGHFIARVDGIWRDRSLVLEVDGRGKYLDRVEPSSAATHTTAAEVARAVLEEKLREDRVRGLGLTVVRADSREIEYDIDAVGRRLWAHFDGDTPPSFSGQFRSHPRARITPDNPGPLAADMVDMLRPRPRKRRATG